MIDLNKYSRSATVFAGPDSVHLHLQVHIGLKVIDYRE